MVWVGQWCGWGNGGRMHIMHIHLQRSGTEKKGACVEQKRKMVGKRGLNLTWEDKLKRDSRKVGLYEEDVQDRNKRKSILLPWRERQ